MRWSGVSLLMLMMLGVAHADRIDSQRQRLRSTSYKVRLSAALDLSKSRDDRAVMALSVALGDRESSVRQVAVLGLGKNVGSQTAASVRKRVVAALGRVASRDTSSRVRRAAKQALAEVSKHEPTTSQRPARPGSVFLHLTEPSDPTHSLSTSVRRELMTAVSRTINKHAPTFGMASRKAELPTQSELERQRLHGFYVGAQVAQLTVQRQGSQAEVRCKVAVRVGPWNGRDGGEIIVADRSASASGSARVVGSGSKRGIVLSQRDCVVAVAEEITARQVVPFLERASR